MTKQKYQIDNEIDDILKEHNISIICYSATCSVVKSVRDINSASYWLFDSKTNQRAIEIVEIDYTHYGFGKLDFNIDVLKLLTERYKTLKVGARVSTEFGEGTIKGYDLGTHKEFGSTSRYKIKLDNKPLNFKNIELLCFFKKEITQID